MGDLVVRPGDSLRIEWGGQVYDLKVVDLSLDGPKDIRWQPGGKPPKLRSVRITVREENDASRC